MGDVAMRDVAMGDVAMRDVAMRDVAMGDVARRDVAMGDVFERLGFWVGDQRSATRNGGVTRALIKESPNPSAVEGPKNLDTEPHKYFDQVVITVRSGDGGNGAVLKLPKPKVEDKESKFKKKDKKSAGTYKRGNDGALILPMGGHGGDVVLVADESADTLLPFHRKKRHNGKRGANVSSMGTLSPALRDGLDGPVLRIPVPVGKAFLPFYKTCSMCFVRICMLPSLPFLNLRPKHANPGFFFFQEAWWMFMDMTVFL
jgi:hypothetical protein